MEQIRIKKKTLYISLAVLLLVVGGVFAISFLNNNKEKDTSGGETITGYTVLEMKESLAKCLTESGAVFYGTEWCGFCTRQKEKFGDSFEHVNYVECTEEQEKCSEAGVSAYPTWFINGQLSPGMKTPEQLAALSGCEYDESKAETGSEQKQEVEGQIIILNDERCEECALISNMVGQLQAMFPGFPIDEIDYSEDDGKEIYTQSGLTYLPAVLFSPSVRDHSNYNEVQDYLDEKGDFLSLRVGGRFNPTKEICDNGIDDTGNGLIDCEDPDCIDTLICNPDLFAECAAEFGVSPETVIFYYTETCPWCTLMIPGIEELEQEGYSFIWAEAGVSEHEEMINKCFREYMGSGVPQFICPSTAEIRPGAFADSGQNLDIDAMRAWADSCIEG